MIIALVPTMVHAQTSVDTGTDPEHSATTIEQYALAFGLDLGEADRRLKLQSTAAAFHDEVAKALGPDYGGVAIEHDPTFHVRVLLPPGAPAETVAEVADNFATLDIRTEPAQFTYEELTNQRVEATRVLKASATDSGAFLQRPGTLTKVDPKTGVIRIYEPSTNTFGAYNPTGSTRTFYRPDPAAHGYPTNLDYWNAQPG